MPFVKVAYLADIPAGTMTAVVPIDNPIPITIANVEGTLYAFDSICTHAAIFLAAGFLDGYEVTCPGHFGAFDVRTGAATQPPAALPIKTYPVRLDGEDVEVDLPAA